MKKLINIIICNLLACVAFAQISTKVLPVTQTPVVFNDLTVYEQPNLSGNSGKIKISKLNGLIFPFTNLTNASFKIAAHKIVYLKYCLEFPVEVAFTETQTNIDLSKVCGIRSDDMQWVGIGFNGISTEIHNNDCKRVYGNITVKMQETSPYDNNLFTFFSTNSFTPFRNTDKTGPYLLNIANSSADPIYTNYVFNNNPVPNITTGPGTRSRGRADVGFWVGKAAVRDGRIKIFINSKIGSAHKSCDLCDDFSSKVEMARAKTEAIPINYLYDGEKLLNAENNKLILGPYPASGSRDGTAITASGGTNKNFRVHLTIGGL